MGQLTHSTRNVLFNPLVSKDASNTILFVEEPRSYARARARKERNHTHNMPEKHQMFARPNRTLKIIGTAREESKSA